MSTAYIGVGGNLGDVVTTIHSALNVLKQSQNIQSVLMSSFYESKPLDILSDKPVEKREEQAEEQPRYINSVAAIETTLSPNDLLVLLQTIELKFGRVRTAQQWASRTLDLDILLFDDLQQFTERLTIPHAEMLKRDFVLTPLFEIAPELTIAGFGSLENALAHCENRGLIKLSIETSVTKTEEKNEHNC